MITLTEVLRSVLSALNSTDVGYMIVGSVAASFHGLSRVTHDIDIVISISPDAIPGLADTLGDAFYFDVISARQAVQRQDMFNIIHMESGIKVDFWIPPDSDLCRSQLARRVKLDFGGVDACIESAEDTILSKLLWYRQTPSERQIADIRTILTAKEGKLDWGYLDSWAERLGVKDLLHQLAEEISSS